MDVTRRSALMAAPISVAPFGLSACATVQHANGGGPATAARVSAWLDRYKQAWETKDAAAAGALFTEGAIYHEQPFEAPMQGRAAVEAYWTRVTAGQENIVFTHDVIAASGDTGVAHWHAAFNAAPGDVAIELDGVFVCTFADATTVSALKEWWHVKTPPPPAAAPG